MKPPVRNSVIAFVWASATRVPQPARVPARRRPSALRAFVAATPALAPGRAR